MTALRRFDHVGITTQDLDVTIAFFEILGLQLEGRMVMEGKFVDTVIGMPGSRSEIAVLRCPDGGTGIELSAFVHPEPRVASAAPMSNEVGLRNVMFEVNDLDELLARFADHGYGLVGGVGEYEGQWRMAYVHGPSAIILALAQRRG